MMHEHLQELEYFNEHFDVMMAPDVGPMELQEMGIGDILEYDPKYNFAYKMDVDCYFMRDFLTEIAETLRISESEREIEDRFNEIVIKTFMEMTKIELRGGFWIIFWYNAGVGTLYRQGKLELYLRPHSEEPLETYQYYDVRKKVWLQNLAQDLKHKYKLGIELPQLNMYLKKRDMLWILEEVVTEYYDLWDFVQDINKKMEEIE